MNVSDCYRMLGLRTGASLEEIKASYRRLARQLHPDVNPTAHSRSHDRFIEVTKAYQTLLEIAEAEQSSVQSPSLKEKATQEPLQPEDTVDAASLGESRSSDADESLSPADQKLKENAYKQLRVLLRSQRFPRAIALVEGLAQRLPQDIEIRQWQAITYQQWAKELINQVKLDKARIYLQKAARTDPNNQSLQAELQRDFNKLEKQQQNIPLGH